MALTLPGASTKSVFTTPASLSFSTATSEWRYAHFRFSGSNPTGITSAEDLIVTVVSAWAYGGLYIAANSANISTKLSGPGGSLNKVAKTPLPTVGTDIRVLLKHDYTTNGWALFYNGAKVLSGNTSIGTEPTSKANARSVQLAGSASPGADLVIEQFGLGINGNPTDAEALAFTSGTLEVTGFSAPPAWQYKPTGTGIVSSFTTGGLTFTQAAGATSGTLAPTLSGAVSAVTFAITEIVDNHAVGGLSMPIANTSTVAFAARSAATGRLNITVRGTYSGGTPTGIALSFGSSTFASAPGATISGGTFEATFDIAQTGFGLRIANTADLGTYQTYANIRAGDRWVICGQSNAGGFVDGSSPTDPLPATFRYGTTLIKSNRDTGALSIVTGPSGDMVYTWALAMVQYATGVPICYANVAIGGTSITTWQSGAASWTTADGWMTATAMKGHANKPRLLWNQGENDVSYTPAAYEAAFTSFLASAQGTWGLGAVWSLPIFSSPGCNPVIGVRNLARKRSDVRMVADSDWLKLAPDAVHTDIIHLQSPIDAAMMGALLGQDIIGAIGASGAMVPAMTQDLFVGSAPIERIMLGGVKI